MKQHYEKQINDMTSSYAGVREQLKKQESQRELPREEPGLLYFILSYLSFISVSLSLFYFYKFNLAGCCFVIQCLRQLILSLSLPSHAQTKPKQNHEKYF